MKISKLVEGNKKTFSFEFFPPKDEAAAVDFGINVGQLMKLDPSFVSVTYGAGGSNQDKAFTLVDYLQNKIGLTTMAHYTCVGSGRDKVTADMSYLQRINIENLMLLRGDPPQGSPAFVAHKDGFSYASELISHVRRNFSFSIGAAAYPEKHPEAENPEKDLDNLLIKYRAGADFLITQLFFNNKAYFDFVRRARDKGINCRIIPGILPITSYGQIPRSVKISSAYFPEDLLDRITAHRNDPEKVYQIGMDHAVRQCISLLEWGAPGIHFYTLNKSRAAVEVFESLPAALKSR